MSASVVHFDDQRRGATLVRQIAASHGYGRITQAQLARTFRPSPTTPLRGQAAQHVPLPHQSAMTGH